MGGLQVGVMFEMFGVHDRPDGYINSIMPSDLPRLICYPYDLATYIRRLTLEIAS